jgi:hypothetical protein
VNATVLEPEAQRNNTTEGRLPSGSGKVKASPRLLRFNKPKNTKSRGPLGLLGCEERNQAKKPGKAAGMVCVLLVETKAVLELLSPVCMGSTGGEWSTFNPIFMEGERSTFTPVAVHGRVDLIALESLRYFLTI